MKKQTPAKIVRRLLELSKMYKNKQVKIDRAEKGMRTIVIEATKLRKSLHKEDEEFYAEKLKKSLW